MTIDEKITAWIFVDAVLVSALLISFFTSYFSFAWQRTEPVAPMPNRFATVSFLCERHPEAFPQDENNDAARLAFLKGTIIPTLNRTDDGKWGYMTKTDQGGKVPCDILMWRDTNQVVDCLTGIGAAWLEHAPPPPAWVWTSVDVAPPEPIPPTPHPPSGHGDPYSDAQVIEFTDDCILAFVSVGATPDKAASVWIGRMQFDATQIGYAKAREKQLRALKDALGA